MALGQVLLKENPRVRLKFFLMQKFFLRLKEFLILKENPLEGQK